MEDAGRQSRKAFGIDEVVREPEVIAGRQLEREDDPFGMMLFDRLHEPRSLGGYQRSSLALGDRERSSLWTADHDHGDADMVQVGDVGNARDSEDGL